MKKITLLMVFAIVCSFAFAQTKMTQVQHLPLAKNVKISHVFNKKDLSASDVVCNTTYYADTTMDLEFTVTITTADFEYGDSLALTFPTGITPNSSPTDPLAIATESQPDEALNGVFGQTISWGDNDNSYGGIEPGPHNFIVNVTIDPGVTGNQLIAYYISGDQFANPADASGNAVATDVPPPPTTVIWEDDFSTPANWVISADWQIGTDVDAGDLVTYTGSMTSTTAGNGYGFINEIQYLLSPPPTIKDVNIAWTGTPIDLSANAGVLLTFEQNYRSFNSDEVYVEVSNDGGATWTSFQVNSAIAVNDYGPPSITLDISTVAGGSPNVFVRFRWVTTSNDPSFGGGYGWMVDDVAIIETPDNDLVLVTDSDMVYLDAWQVSIYGQIPITQTGTTTFAARVANAGSATQTNIVLNVDVNDGSGSVFNSGDTLPSLAAGANALFTITPGFSPSSIGTYTIIFTVSSDSTDANPVNNTTVVSYEITDTVFARDNGSQDFELNISMYSQSGPTPNGSSYEFGNWYETVNADTATSISVVFGPSTIVGTNIQGKIYDENEVLLESTAYYSIQPGDVSGSPPFPTVTLPLAAPLPLGDLSNYIVTIADYSGTDTATTIIASYDDHLYATSFYMHSGGLGAIVETPFIRLNLAMLLDTCTAILTSSVTDISCFGADDGVIDLTVTDGTLPFTYLWSNSSTNEDISSLSGGSFSVIFTDGLGCMDSITGLVVNEPAALSLTTDSTTATCGTFNGSATVNVTGGTSPYNYLWNPGSQTTAIASNLSGGSYTVTVTDTNGCIAFANVTVPSTPAVAFTTSKTDPSTCSSGDGTATATITGGTPPYTYQWIPTLQDSSTATGLSSGTYTITITDSNGCSANDIVILVDAAAATLTISDSTMVSCNGESDGSANVNASGGTLPYAYSWDNGENDSTAIALAVGTRLVTVTDGGGCVSVIGVVITQPDALALSTSATDVSCFGGTDGKASVAATGGTGAYAYLWSTLAITDSISGLSPDSYTVLVTDANNCVDSVTSIIVGEPNVLVVTLTGCVSETADGQLDGSVSIGVIGGTGSYTYLWSNGATTPNISNLDGGTYSVTVTDANGCTDDTSCVVADGPVGITELNNDITFSIYPNPTNGQFVVEFSNQVKDDYLIEVRNIIGQLIYSEKIDNVAGEFTKQIDLSEYRGVYFLNISNSSGTRTEKLIVY